MNAIAVPLLADVDWIKVLPAIIFFAIWLINQLLSGKKDPAAQQRRPPRPAGGQPPPAPQRNAPPEQAKLSTEIEEFLRRASEKRREKAREVQARPRPVPRTLRPADEPVEAEVVETGPPGERVAKHVEQHLTTRSFTQRASHMVDDILEADVERKQHEQQVFGHHIGRLEDTSTGSQTPPQSAESAKVAATAAVGSLAALLKSRESVRQAIIINEILNRPEHRW